MILLSSPLKNDPPETTVSILFFLEIETVTTKIINSKSLKKICRKLLSTMNVLKDRSIIKYGESLASVVHSVQRMQNSPSLILERA